jgi:hypothetical protein
MPLPPVPWPVRRTGGRRRGGVALHPDHDREVPNKLISQENDCAAYRLLARALDGECELTPDEWRRRAKAIEAYLRSPELQRPMLGAQRRIEARIGQLLGPGAQGQRTDLLPHHSEEVPNQLIPHDEDRAAFRLLARALDGECELSVLRSKEMLSPEFGGEQASGKSIGS